MGINKQIICVMVFNVIKKAEEKLEQIKTHKHNTYVCIEYRTSISMLFTSLGQYPNSTLSHHFIFIQFI